jgi:hypothetical protein
VICLQGRIDPQLVTPGRMFRLAGSAGRGFVANVYVATTHDGCPLLRRAPNAQAQGKLHGVRLSRPDRRFGSSGQPMNEAVFVRERRGQSGPNGQLAVFSPNLSSEGVVAEFIEFFRPLFRPEEPTKQFACATKPFSVFGADVRKQPTVITWSTRRRALPATDNRRQSDADDQFHSRLRLHPGWSFDGWFFRPAPAGRRYLRLSWLAGCDVCIPADGRGRQLSVTNPLQKDRR